MKALGSEIMAFYEAWPVGDDWYQEDGYEPDDDGKLPLDPSKSYDVEDVLGYFAWQGNGKMPKTLLVEDVFAAWRGDKRPYTVLLSPEDAEKFKALCAEHGWEVTS